MDTVTLAELATGQIDGSRCSDWMTIDQVAIGAFGALTHDPDPNHIDPQWAAAHSPFGGPIAFGFQTLAMLTALAKSAGVLPTDATDVFNYGLDRVRFVAAVPAGSRIRGRFEIAEVSRRAHDRLLVTYAVEVEVEGVSDRPAMVAHWLGLFEGVLP